tara:strand:- start:4127 stop:4261 length:135 start_codon:yes stop_codon:yes gene_type:complete
MNKMTKEGTAYAKCLAYEDAARLQKKNDEDVRVVNKPQRIRISV